MECKPNPAVTAFKAERMAQGAWDANGNRTKKYVESLIGQTRLWVEGISTHNRVTGECCHDFSCCRPDMLRPREEREQIAQKQILEWTGDEAQLA